MCRFVGGRHCMFVCWPGCHSAHSSEPSAVGASRPPAPPDSPPAGREPRPAASHSAHSDAVHSPPEASGKAVESRGMALQMQWKGEEERHWKCSGRAREGSIPPAAPLPETVGWARCPVGSAWRGPFQLHCSCLVRHCSPGTDRARKGSVLEMTGAASDQGRPSPSRTCWSVVRGRLAASCPG